MALLEIDNLSLTLGARRLLKGVSLSLEAGQVLGLVGESGSGKSLTALSVLGLAPPGAVLEGAIRLEGVDLLSRNEAQMNAIRGPQIGMVFQEPMTALNPVRGIGDQVAETVRLHRRVGRAEANRLAAETLGRVGLPAERFPLSRYPHELSGGQRQRVAIAMAVALAPRLILADEPTTALDVTTQAQILDLLITLSRQDGAGLVLVSHDLALVAQTADRVAVMQAGAIVEQGETGALFAKLSHPYSRALAAAAEPRLRKVSAAPANKGEPVLEAAGVTRDYATERTSLFRPAAPRRAVDGVSLTLAPGESLGLVGESGCGKTTLTRAILGLDPGASGQVRIGGEAFDHASATDRRRLRRRIQAVFQDPFGSFDPRWRVARIIGEPFALFDAPPEPREQRRRTEALLEQVGLKGADADRYPHEFSGGQRQRIAIARALITEPSVVVLDEATSALDVTVRAQILALLEDLSERMGLAYLFVSHDLAVVRAITDRVMVMQAGRIVETGPTAQVFAAPSHPYTAQLLAATPSLERALRARDLAQSAAQSPSGDHP
ncbi:MAG: dipeptide ABC transporter ATP-binding protein [Caulobacteraceae bacterium]|nr:dipeptide ABC transporter ATP-binding protein [Caulobacteraceae bacterium]